VLNYDLTEDMERKMKKSFLLSVVCPITFAVLTNTTHADVVNPILGLNIGGTLYDVTFHDSAGDTFNALWDADGDGVFLAVGPRYSTRPQRIGETHQERMQRPWRSSRH